MASIPHRYTFVSISCWSGVPVYMCLGLTTWDRVTYQEACTWRGINLLSQQPSVAYSLPFLDVSLGDSAHLHLLGIAAVLVSSGTALLRCHEYCFSIACVGHCLVADILIF